jgi:4-hydroxy-2-oxoheptanedioate aldolase
MKEPPPMKLYVAAIKTICTVTRKRGKIAGVHTDSAQTAIRRFGEGYQLCTILSDARLMANAASAAVREARGQMAQVGTKTY